MVVLICCIIVLIVNIILWILFFKIFKKSFSANGALSEIKQEAEKIIIEINRVTDESITLIEGKMSQIRDVIESADKKIMLYENTLIQKENEKQLFQQLSEYEKKSNSIQQRAIKGYKANSGNNSDSLPLFTEYAGTSDLKKTKQQKKTKEQMDLFQEENSSKTESKNDSLELNFSEKKEVPQIEFGEKIEPKVSMQEQIIKLAKEGFTADLIARKLNISINEVTMTIDLFL